MTEPTALPACSHCGHVDADEIGDHDSLVARCSTCDVLTCGTCWDELHADTCGEPDPYADADADEPEPEHTYCPRGLRRDHETCPADELGKARLIASWWHGGQGSALYALSSSGTILPGAVDEVTETMGHVLEPADADDVSWLWGYLEDNAAAEPSPSPERPTLGPWPKTPSLTRQHFAYIARILAELGRDHGDKLETEQVVTAFAYHLSDCNPRFDRDRFLAAARGQS